MRTLLIACTTLIILQILDVWITGVSSAALKGVSNVDPSNRSPSSKIDPQNTRNAARPLTDQVPATVPVAQQPQDVNDDQYDIGMDPDDDMESPDEFVDLDMNMMNTLTDEFRKRGAEVFDVGTGLLRTGSDVLGSFNDLVNDQMKNVRQVSGDAFEMLNGLGDSNTKGIENLFGTATQIGNEQANTMFDVLNEAMDTSMRAIKFARNAMTTPVSMGNDILGFANMFANGPKDMSRFMSKNIIDNVKPILGDDNDDDDYDDYDDDDDDDDDYDDEYTY